MGWLKQSGPQGVAHRCRVPRRSRFVANDTGFPKEEFLVAPGDAWQCDACGVVWVVVRLGDVPYWRVATNRQRKRLVEG